MEIIFCVFDFYFFLLCSQKNNLALKAESLKLL